MSKKFSTSKCLIQLKLALNRIKFQFKKKHVVNDSLKREIYNLIQLGKNEEARIKILTLILNINHINTLKLLESHCHEIIPRVNVIGSQVTCPVDIKESVCSIVYAAPFMDYVPEFTILREMFINKFGKEFPNECIHCNCVSVKIIRKLSSISLDDSIVDSYYQLIANLKSKDEDLPYIDDENDNKINFVGDNSDQDIADSSLSLNNEFSENNLLEAKILKDRNNHHWAITNKYGKENPVYIPHNRLANAKHGDDVIILLDKRKDGKYSGAVECVINCEDNKLISDIYTEKSTSPSTYENKYVTGQFRLDSNYHSWLIQGNQNPIFIPPDCRNNASDGDYIEAEILQIKDGKTIGVVKNILSKIKSNEEEIFGIIKLDNEQNGIVFDINNPFAPTIFIPKEHTMNVETGDKVVVTITGRMITNNLPMISGKITKIINNEILNNLQDINDSALEEILESDEDDVDLNTLNISFIERPHSSIFMEEDINISGKRSLSINNNDRYMESYSLEELHELEIDEDDDKYDELTSLLENSLNIYTSDTKHTHLSLDEVIILDIGSESIKIGNASQSTPNLFPNVIGRIREGVLNGNFNNDSKSQHFAGFEALSKKSMLKLIHPMMNGIVENLDDLKEVLNSSFELYDIKSSKCTFIITESTTNPTVNRDKFINTFKNFNSPNVYLAQSSHLSLLSSEKNSGLVIDLGHTTSSIVPIYEGFIIDPAIEKFSISGLNITEYLMNLLKISGKIKGDSFSVLEEVKMIKERYSYINHKKQKVPKDIKHITKDGSEIDLLDEVSNCCEVLFNPHLIGKDVIGLHEMIKRSIQKCDIDIRTALIENIILTGGTSLIKGLKERLYEELVDIYPKVNIISSEIRHYQAWMGGVKLARISKRDFRGNSIIKLV